MSISDYVTRRGPMPEVDFIGEPKLTGTGKPVLYRRDRRTIISYHMEMTPSEAIIYASALLELATGQDRWKHPPV